MRSGHEPQNLRQRLAYRRAVAHAVPQPPRAYPAATPYMAQPVTINDVNLPQPSLRPPPVICISSAESVLITSPRNRFCDKANRLPVRRKRPDSVLRPCEAVQIRSLSPFLRLKTHNRAGYDLAGKIFCLFFRSAHLYSAYLANGRGKWIMRHIPRANASPILTRHCPEQTLRAMKSLTPNILVKPLNRCCPSGWSASDLPSRRR